MDSGKRPSGRVVAISEPLHRQKKFIGFMRGRDAKKKVRSTRTTDIIVPLALLSQPFANDTNARLLPNSKHAPAFQVNVSELPDDWVENYDQYKVHTSKYVPLLMHSYNRRIDCTKSNSKSGEIFRRPLQRTSAMAKCV